MDVVYTPPAIRTKRGNATFVVFNENLQITVSCLRTIHWKNINRHVMSIISHNCLLIIIVKSLSLSLNLFYLTVRLAVFISSHVLSIPPTQNLLPLNLFGRPTMPPFRSMTLTLDGSQTSTWHESIRLPWQYKVTRHSPKTQTVTYWRSTPLWVYPRVISRMYGQQNPWFIPRI